MQAVSGASFKVPCSGPASTSTQACYASSISPEAVIRQKNNCDPFTPAPKGGSLEASEWCLPAAVSPPHLALLICVQPELQCGHQLAVEGTLQAVTATVHQGTLLLSAAGRVRQAGRRDGAGAALHQSSVATVVVPRYRPLM